jgi:hypothetical protein
MFIAGAAYSQNLSGGVRLGLNISNLKSTYDGGSSKDNARLSGHLGGYITYEFKDKMAFQPELIISGEGSRSEIGNDKVKNNLTYVNIPLLFRYNFTEELNLHTGPQIGILASAKRKVDGDTDDVKDGLKGTNISWAIGAGYELPNNLNVGLRYNIGLSDIVDTVNDSKLKANTFQIYVGYTLFSK